MLQFAATERTSLRSGAKADGSGDFKTALADASSRGTDLRKIANRKSNELDQAGEFRESDDEEFDSADAEVGLNVQAIKPTDAIVAPIQIVGVASGENAEARENGNASAKTVELAVAPNQHSEFAESRPDSSTESSAKDSGSIGRTREAADPEASRSFNGKLVATASVQNTAITPQGETSIVSDNVSPELQANEHGRIDNSAIHSQVKADLPTGVTKEAASKSSEPSLGGLVKPSALRTAGDNSADSTQIPVRTDAGEETGAVLRDPAQERPSDTANDGETAFQEKVRRWIDGRREGDAVNKAGRPDPAGASTVDTVKPPMAVTRKTGSRFDVAVEAVDGTEKVKVDAGQGDGAAASVARLLVQGVGRQESTDKTTVSMTQHAPAPVSLSSDAAGSANGGHAAATAVTSPGGIVADLLAATDESKNAVENVARALNASGGSGRFQATMRLDPPELGHVKVQIRMQAEAMTLQVQAENLQVSKLIESRMGELRDALATHGIRIDRAEVVVKTPDTGESLNHPNQERSHNESHRGQGEQSRSNAQDGGWSQGRGWHATREDGGHGNGTPSWVNSSFAGAGELGSAGEPSTDRWMPILDGSVDLVA